MFHFIEIFNTLTTHFLHNKNSVQCPLQQTSAGAVAQEHVYLQNSVGVWAE